MTGIPFIDKEPQSITSLSPNKYTLSTRVTRNRSNVCPLMSCPVLNMQQYVNADFQEDTTSGYQYFPWVHSALAIRNILN